jgi:hypothetical protein|uniref:Uncharacterized protein n=1 Tax=Halalkalibacterium halodurans TaxID=86665 RepID=A0A0M0KHL7_ALKHA
MARHKPYLYTIFVIATLLLIWGAYSINQSLKWGGATEDTNGKRLTIIIENLMPQETGSVLSIDKGRERSLL